MEESAVRQLVNEQVQAGVTAAVTQVQSLEERASAVISQMQNEVGLVGYHVIVSHKITVSVILARGGHELQVVGFVRE